MRVRLGSVRWRAGLLGLALAVTGCGTVPPQPAGPSSAPAASSMAASPSPAPAPGRTPPPPPEPSGDPTTTRPPESAPTSARRVPGLRGDRRNGFAFAPLDRPEDVTVEGGVRTGPAWSTSKVLVVAAFLDTVAGGDPARVGTGDRRRIEASLAESDADAILALRARIPGRPARAMTTVLREIGDTATVVPDEAQGLMIWSLREQVRFVAALSAGRVVSRAASAYLLREMRPIAAHRWGLGTISASAFKGGWLRADTVTRQLGIVDGFAVAIITDGVGPAVRQSDGDLAHVRQLNRLARLLARRLAVERARR